MVSFQCLSRRVRRADHIFKRKKRIFRFGRLLLIYIHGRGTQSARFEGLAKRRFVNKRAARCILEQSTDEAVRAAAERILEL